MNLKSLRCAVVYIRVHLFILLAFTSYFMIGAVTTSLKNIYFGVAILLMVVIMCMKTCLAWTPPKFSLEEDFDTPVRLYCPLMIFFAHQTSR